MLTVLRCGAMAWYWWLGLALLAWLRLETRFREIGAAFSKLADQLHALNAKAERIEKDLNSIRYHGLHLNDSDKRD